MLAIVQPATVIAWNRRGFRRLWPRSSKSWTTRTRQGWVASIERLARKSRTWSRRRIAAELATLGDRVSEDTVAKYTPKAPGRPRGRSRVQIDFLIVPTVTFDIVCVLFMLSLDGGASFT